MGPSSAVQAGGHAGRLLLLVPSPRPQHPSRTYMAVHLSPARKRPACKARAAPTRGGESGTVRASGPGRGRRSAQPQGRGLCSEGAWSG